MQKLNRQQLPADVLNELYGKADQVYVDEKFSEFSSVVNSIPSDSGDYAIMPFNNEAPVTYTMQNRNIDNVEIDGSVGYKDNLPGGYVFTGAADSYRNKTFNRIKVFVKVPGWVRIGIVRGTGNGMGKDQGDGVARGIFKANARYDATDVYPSSLVKGVEDSTADDQAHATLKKWLVVQYAATVGVHEYDFEDEIITSPFEYIYEESRSGVAGFVYNKSGAAVTTGNITIPNGAANTGLTYPTTAISATNLCNGQYPISDNMLDTSARLAYFNEKSARGGGYHRRWTDISYNQTDKTVDISQNRGDLNIGLYRRGVSGTKYLQPVIENALTRNMSTSEAGTGHIKGYGPKYEDQQLLAQTGARIYAIEVIIAEPGDLSFFVFSSNDPATCRILKHFTLRTRGIGKQLIHLPEDIILQEGNWCGVEGITQAVTYNRPVASEVFSSGTTLAQGYVDTAKFVYRNPSSVKNWTCKGDDPTAIQDLIPYSSAIGTRSSGFIYWKGVQYVPGANAGEGYVDFTNASIAEDNKNYLNICLVVRDEPISKLEDLWCSITGDSISTYAGVISKADDYGMTYLNAAGDNACYYPNNGSGFTNCIDSTWWGALIKQTRMRLLRNDAWSGSKVSGTDSSTSSTACASDIRSVLLRNISFPTYQPIKESGKYTHPYGTPDIVFTCIGTNDLAGGVTPGSYSNEQPADISTILSAFEKMVGKHKTNYPQSILVYFVLPRGSSVYPYTNATTEFSIAQMADSFEYIAKAMGVYFVPLSYFNALNVKEVGAAFVWTPNSGTLHKNSVTFDGTVTTDKLHPSATGHQIIANALQRFCEQIV